MWQTNDYGDESDENDIYEAKPRDDESVLWIQDKGVLAKMVCPNVSSIKRHSTVIADMITSVDVSCRANILVLYDCKRCRYDRLRRLIENMRYVC